MERDANSDEYDVVSFRVHWAGVSLAAFVATLPFNYGHAWRWPFWTVKVVGAICTVGFIAGLIAFKDRDRRRAATAGIALNGVALVLLSLLQLIYSTI